MVVLFLTFCVNLSKIVIFLKNVLVTGVSPTNFKKSLMLTFPMLRSLYVVHFHRTFVGARMLEQFFFSQRKLRFHSVSLH